MSYKGPTTKGYNKLPNPPKAGITLKNNRVSLVPLTSTTALQTVFDSLSSYIFPALTQECPIIMPLG
jgi:hypothetical protein